MDLVALSSKIQDLKDLNKVALAEILRREDLIKEFQAHCPHPLDDREHHHDSFAGNHTDICKVCGKVW